MQLPTSGLASAVVVGLLLQFSAGFVHAAPVTFCGSTLCYDYDDAQAAVAWFGQPGFVGDDAYFLPATFEARSADGIGLHTAANTDEIDVTWVFSRVWSLDASREIVSIAVAEEGDYRVNYAGGGVRANLDVRVVGLNTSEPLLLASDALDRPGHSGGLQAWAMSAALTPAETLMQLANNLSVSIQSRLFAFSDDSTAGPELAWIERKLVLQVNTTVPAPAAIWLLGTAVGGLGVLRFRKRH